MHDKCPGRMVSAPQKLINSRYPFSTMTVGGKAYQVSLNDKSPGAVRSAIRKTKLAVVRGLGEYWRFKTEIGVDEDGIDIITVWRTK